MIHELEQKGYEIRKKGGTVINKKAGKSCGKRKIVQISNASSELIKATIIQIIEFDISLTVAN